jgi:hypothetical protein
MSALPLDSVLVVVEAQATLLEVLEPQLLVTDGPAPLQVLEVPGPVVTELLTLVEDSVTLLTAVEQGPEGSGGGSAALPPVAFAFGDASPRSVYTPPVGVLVKSVRLLVDIAFNGAGAALQLQAGAKVLMPAGLNDPLTKGEYDSSPQADVAAGTPFVLTINPGAGATQGAGRLIFETLVP